MAGLVGLTLFYQVLAGVPHQGSRSLWDLAYPLAAWVGLLLPYATFAGGLAAFASLSPRSVALRGFLLSIVFMAMLAQYEVSDAPSRLLDWCFAVFVVAAARPAPTPGGQARLSLFLPPGEESP